MPSVRRIAEESGIAAASVAGTGKDGRVTKGDMLGALEARAASAPQPAAAPRPAGPRPNADARRARGDDAAAQDHRAAPEGIAEHRRPAHHLQRGGHEPRDGAAQPNTRTASRRSTACGWASWASSSRPCIAALKELPNVNAEIEGDDIVYKNYYDIGIAVSTERGLVVPVVRDADQLSLAGIEKAIDDFGLRARDNKLKLEELQGGTFSITNGGVFGSLMSTPILNSPQSGILGMHKIQPRPMAIDDKVEIRPMMYLALSYDHRLVDGREAVTFLVRVKENLEDPQRLLLDI